MIKRIAQFLGGTEAQRLVGDYWVITTATAWYAVTRETADRVRDQLDAKFEPRWVRFRDVFGAETQVRAGDVLVISESTGDQRAGYRALNQALQAEADPDRQRTDGQG
ncbi:MAG: hypothetical protein R3314_13510 [Longimicrobiales bacterium]|nr:hypothetical protein [Longimicrobiales bacterium]